VVVTVSALGRVHLTENQSCCGIRIDEQKSWRVDMRPRLTKSIYPELWIDKSLPVVKIGQDEPGDRQFHPHQIPTSSLRLKSIFGIRNTGALRF
jgi:hypothetical protein